MAPEATIDAPANNPAEQSDSKQTATDSRAPEPASDSAAEPVSSAAKTSETPEPAQADTGKTAGESTQTQKPAAKPTEEPGKDPDKEPGAKPEKAPAADSTKEAGKTDKKSDNDSDQTADKTTDKTANKAPDSEPDKEPDKQSDKESNKETNKESDKESAKAKTPPPFDPISAAKSLADLLEQSAQIGFKNTGNLSTARKSLARIKQHIPDAETVLLEKAGQLQDIFDSAFEKNRQHQEQLQEKTTSLLTALQEALATGQSEKALPTWDKIQGNISNTSGQIRNTLQESANAFKAQITELRDWKIFAATEKKKTLITEMQALAEAKGDAALEPAALSKKISKMHAEWKALGRSNDNEALWKEFKTHSDKAYEPCKEYFKQRKQLMATNLKQRKTICAELEKSLDGIDAETVKVAELSQLLNQADKDWKQYAPVEQNKIKPLQKRYYSLLNRIRKLRKKLIRENSAGKQALITQAQALIKLEDRREAMTKAKQLQQDWKQLGPTTFKEDKKLWDEFRGACDQIFDKRKQESSDLQAQLKAAETELQQVIDKLGALAKLPDDEFRQARSSYQGLIQQFSAALNPKLRKSKARWLDQVNDVKRQIDARYQALPDKKQQAMQAAIGGRTTVLEALEADLLAAGSDAALASALANFDKAQWQALPTSSEAEFDKLLDQRCDSLLGLQSKAQLDDLQSKAAQGFRELCIQAEIKAEADTPAEDQQQRMQMQLAQLQEGFGQQKPTRKELQKFAVESGIKASCFGPLDDTTREQLTARLTKAIQKLA